MASVQEYSWSYKTIEGPFVRYFDRLYSTGMELNVIESKLPQLEKYYQEMVVEKWDCRDGRPFLDDLFSNWKRQHTYFL